MASTKIRETQTNYSVSLKFYSLEWQEPLIGQFAHPQPQEDFPFFLFFTILTIMVATTAISTAQIMIVAAFCESQASIYSTTFLHMMFFRYIKSQFSGLFVRSENHIQHEYQYNHCGNQTDYIQTARENRAELIYHKRNCICKQALINYCKPRPLCGVHLAFNCTECSEAGSAKQVERQEGVTDNSRE